MGIRQAHWKRCFLALGIVLFVGGVTICLIDKELGKPQIAIGLVVLWYNGGVWFRRRRAIRRAAAACQVDRQLYDEIWNEIKTDMALGEICLLVQEHTCAKTA